MSTEINETVRAIGEGCTSHPGVVPELLLAAVPEFLGGLAVALVTALVARALHLRRGRRAVSAAAAEEPG
ncbi:hypothetical protein [Streptomyces sp. A1-5]|uniref:hypothetical protein n=1 Tax=Streptomyces sp. A1-5 TaxID=2738410 RepID=UPI001F27D09B|nr:hypothetical protein [Streptomyces sp. A1-5]UJB44493.1 hypothetical protein HRD51_30130 [Streptomyces sp. A1-5]